MNTQQVARAAVPIGARGPKLRLTARGRMVKRCLGWAGAAVAFVIVAVTAVLIVSAAIAPGAQAGDGSAAPGEPTISVTVGPGDTLWSLARRHQPNSDPRQVVADIERLNGLEQGSLLPLGARLRLPMG